MPAPLSKDLRMRIIKALEAGDKVSDISKKFSVSSSAVYSIKKLYTITGGIEPKPLNNGRKSKLSDEQLKQVEQLIVQKSDITLNQIKEQLDLPVCLSALSKIIRKKLNFKRKKRHYLTKP